MSIIQKPKTMIPFKNDISIKSEEHHMPLKPAFKSLVLEAKPKLWSAKYFLHETCDEHDHKEMGKVGEGVTVFAIYGNYGTTTWKNDGHTTTVEDYFTISKGITLTVKDINVSCHYEIWVLNYGHENKQKELRSGDVLKGGKTYILQLRKKAEHGHATPYFDIPCNSVNSFAITFSTEAEHCVDHEKPECYDHKEQKDHDNKKEIKTKEPDERFWDKIASFEMEDDLFE